MPAARFMAAGGWGWVLGDDGGASALVREATKAALYARDDGKPDDGLLGALVKDYGVADAERLTRIVNDEPTMDNWAPHAPAVFAAADAGSPLAIKVIDDGARALADNVRQIRARGAVGSDVVVAGSVFINQTRLLEAFTRHLAKTGARTQGASPGQGAGRGRGVPRAQCGGGAPDMIEVEARIEVVPRQRRQGHRCAPLGQRQHRRQ